MKILFLSKGTEHDYQCDMLYHGLRSLLGSDVIDYPRLDFMYQGTEHGGYTVWGLLPDLPVDRDDLPARICTHEFDAVVYGHTTRTNPYWDAVTSTLPASRIALIDGEDTGDTFATTLGSGLYFKRELREGDPYTDMLPIQFGVPKEKIVPDLPPKSRLLAALDPGDRSTYGYVTEDSYREMYQCARFGKTMKKGGWDCCRHYEILANGCVPWFINLAECPPRTMGHLPKALLRNAAAIYESWPARAPEYDDLANSLLDYTRTYLTTEAMARRVLDVLCRS